jgi:uncharacterized protein (TIGR00251 family)
MWNNIFEQHEEFLEFWIYLVPGAKKEAFLGVIQDEDTTKIKISVCARPVENQANRALIKFLSSQFSTAQTNVIIKYGAHSRSKKIRICGCKIEELPKTLLDAVRIQKNILQHETQP